MASLTARLSEMTAMSPGQWLDLTNKRLPPVITALLLIVLAWQLAQLVWKVLPADSPQTIGPASRATTAQTATDANQASEAATRIAGGHIFGVYTPPESAPLETTVADDVEVVEDNEIKVVGMGASTDTRYAFAIVEDNRKKQTVQFIGDQLPNGAELKRVDPDGIVVRRSNGDIVKIAMPRVSSGDGAASSGRVQTRQAARASNISTNLREEIKENPVKFTDIVRPQPVFADGKQRGYRVYPGRDRKKFSELGLKPGDLITEINGTSLDDPAASSEILRALTDATDVSLSLERNGQVEVLNITLN